jgi:hypothetical protein
MPAAMVRTHCKLSPVNLFTARAIAGIFGASPVAAALRSVDLSDELCAALYAARGHVQWMKRGKGFPFRLPIGTKLDPGSVTASVLTGSPIANEPRALPPRIWFGARSHDGFDQIVEHAEVVPEPGWGGVLCLLWLPIQSSSVVAMDIAATELAPMFGVIGSRPAEQLVGTNRVAVE